MKLYESEHKIPIVTILCVFAVINAGYALQCYQCRSDRNVNCASDPRKSYVKECTDTGQVTATNDTTAVGNATNANTTTTLGPYITCRKIIQALYVKSNDLVTIRECGRTYVGSECIKTSNKLVYVLACDCKTDGCNKSSKSSKSYVLTFLCIASILMVY